MDELEKAEGLGEVVDSPVRAKTKHALIVFAYASVLAPGRVGAPEGRPANA